MDSPSSCQFGGTTILERIVRCLLQRAPNPAFARTCCYCDDRRGSSGNKTGWLDCFCRYGLGHPLYRLRSDRTVDRKTNLLLEFAQICKRVFLSRAIQNVPRKGHWKRV